MGRSRSLRSYLTMFALVIATPLFVVAIIATERFADAERARLEGVASHANQDIVLLVNHEIRTQIALLQALSTTSASQTKDYDQLERNVQNLARLKGMHVVLSDPSGKQLFNTRAEPGSPLPDLAEPVPLHVLDSDDGAYISNLLTESGFRAPVVRISVPIREDDAVVAVLSSMIETEQIAEILRKGLPAGPYVALIADRNGTVMARSSDRGAFVRGALKASWEGSAAAQGSLSITDERGVQVFSSWRRSLHSGWVVATTVERAALTEPLKRSLLVLALVSAVLLISGIAGGAWIGRKLVQAQIKLSEAAEAVGDRQIITAPATQLDEADRVGRALADASRSIAFQATELRETNELLERRVAERTRELSSKTALLETTLDTMRQGLIVIDAQDRVPICNARARSMLDLPDALMDKLPTVDELVAHETRQGERAGRAADTERLIRPEPGAERSVFECERPGGLILRVETVPVYGDGGFVRTYLDVTAARWNERVLEAAKEAAEAANRAKDAFLANISHEMRTPLNAMIGYSDLLLNNTSATRDVRRYAERIHCAGGALLSLIDDILELGMIEAGVIDIREQPFAVSALVSDAIAMVRPNADARGLKLSARTEVDGAVLFVSDQDRLRQILLNLLNNAIKFTPSGSVELRVQESDSPDQRSRLRFSVTDTGIGIAKSQQPSLFQRFHQVDPSIDRRFGGAGLGLAITKQLVERLGGRIGLESEIGQGSTFWFEIVLARSQTKAQADQTYGHPDQRPTARVLVAEDVELNQDLAREYLEAAGHRVDVVASGAQAVEAARTGAYDVVLMDLSMPEMDGLTAARLIRSAGVDAARTSIVACTANILPSHVTAFLEAGVDAYLRKPLRRADLYRTIDRVLQHRAEWLETPGTSDQSVVDAEGFESLVALLGPKRVIQALEKLSLELRSLAMAELGEGEASTHLAEQAHTIISTACTLNMTELAERCRDLENACRASIGIPEALERLAPVIAQALAECRRLQVKLEAQAV